MSTIVMPDPAAAGRESAERKFEERRFVRRDLAFPGLWPSEAHVAFMGFLLAVQAVLFFAAEPRNGFMASMGFTLAVGPVLLLSRVWPIRRLIVLVMGVMLFHVAWSSLMIARFSSGDLAGLATAALFNTVCYIVALGPAVLYRGHVAETTNTMFHQRFDVKIAEHRDLQNWNASVVEHQKTMQREVDSISEAFDFMKQIVATLESEPLYKIVRERLKASFRFADGCLAAFNTDEDMPAAVLEVQSLAEERKLAPDELPADLRREIDARAVRVPPEQKEHDGAVIREEDGVSGKIVSCALASGGRRVGAMALRNLHLIGGGGAERDFRLGLFARQLGLGLDKTLLYRRIQAMAMTDNLTGLYVAWYFHQRLEEECRRAAEDRSHAPLVMLDVDHFKRFNDTHGHSAGDEVLKTVANVIRATLREVDFVSRYGGEEFAIILPEISHETAHMIAERLRASIATYDKLPYGKITVSVGLATFPINARSKADLLAAADAALYQAKRTGRNRVCTAPELGPEK